MPTQERLRGLFDYREDGRFISHFTGRPVGTLNGGYLKWNVDGKLRTLHRLIWVWHNGDIPNDLWVDHIDRDRFNNCIENLRLVTPKESGQNKTERGRVWRGAKGLHWHSAEQIYRAVVKNKGKVTYLASSRDPHRLIWLLHLYRVGIYKPRAKVKSE